MTKTNIVICVLLVELLFLACTKEKPNSKQPYLVCNKTVLNFSAVATIDSIVVNSTGRWKISTPSTAWLQPSKDSGDAGSTTVYLRPLANSANTARNTTLTINSLEDPSLHVQIVVNQSDTLKITGWADYRVPGGATLTITGLGFSPVASENAVTINGVKATVQAAMNSWLKLTVPMKAGSGPITVSVGNKRDTTDWDLIYEWVGMVQVIAGGTEGYADGPGMAAKFSHPEGFAFDSNGNLYVADYNNEKVRKIAPNGVVSTVPGRIPEGSNPSGPKTDFGLPTNISSDGRGNLFIVEYNANAITKVAANDTVRLFAGGNSSALVNGIGTAASFNRPTDLAIDASGNIYVADLDNLCIRRITPAGVVSTFAGGQWGYQDGVGQNARFNRPMGIDIDASGNLYVSDYFNSRIRKITPTGTVTTIAGTGINGSTDGLSLTQATFSNPRSIAISRNSTIYVGEANSNNQIRIIQPNGKVETIATFIDATTGAMFAFNGINGLAIDKNGTLFASDYYNNRICKLTYK